MRGFGCALAALSAALVAGVAAEASTIVARAAGVTGRVLLSSANGTPAFALTRGYTLNPGDRVDTRGGGRLVIGLNDGSLVIVQPETVLAIKDFRAAESLRELFEITLGIVRVKINHFAGRPNPYRMNSPTASIAVRGTEFGIAVDTQGETGVEVYEGAVEVSSLADSLRNVLVESGQGVRVSRGQDLRLYNAPDGRGVAQRGQGQAGNRRDPQGRPDGSGDRDPGRPRDQRSSRGR
jgi:ferric-dicitrate binding protein FerR (iron transport regulator)